MIRITGYLRGNSGFVNAEGRIAGVLICEIIDNNVVISNVGFYGLTFIFGGSIASGIIG